ncbi:11737_t:CDS:2 [Funneliformis geosporum]|uniref:13329_t:CDS:1 n=1 Tax=Funneliformis geosporum TaxID=1117311 RepID=A0A9W4SET1_9GLOM|nr:13329_t:CDS:2 [Funneliformis geosporum]CAI2171741.1 11737_t:CDS:2 [Funneliformis geosporum]
MLDIAAKDTVDILCPMVSYSQREIEKFHSRPEYSRSLWSECK